MQEKKNNIKDFIGIYDGYIPDEACNTAIELFKKYDSFNKTWNRFLSENATQDIKQDKSLFVVPEIVNEQDFDLDKLKLLMVNFDIALRHYYTETNIKKYCDSSELITEHIKIQRTLRSEGYHVWHVEHAASRDQSKRVLVYSIYLNDVEEGGETEFLYQSQRVKPVKGRIVIWPAGFPYVHRGNPPLSNEKYIVTSWISYK